MKTRKVTHDEAHANAEAIRQLWEDGCASLEHLEKMPEAVGYGQKEETFSKEATRLGTNIDRAAKMRRAATEYTLKDVEKLCKQVKRYRSRFGPTSLLVLLREPDRDRRDRVMRSAVKESWTTAQLKRAVQAGHGKRRPFVGRHPEIPSDPVQLLVAFDALCEKWIRWCDAAGSSVPKGLRNKMRSATDAVVALKEDVARRAGRGAETL